MTQWGKEHYGADLTNPMIVVLQKVFEVVGVCKLDVGETFVLNPDLEDLPEDLSKDLKSGDGFDSAMICSGAFSRYLRPIMDWDIVTTSDANGKMPNYVLIIDKEGTHEEFDSVPVWVNPDHIRPPS
jgi:hypothetical protein